MTGVTSAPAAVDGGVTRRRPLTGTRRRVLVIGLQLAVAAVFLLAWEYVPRIGSLQRSTHFLDPFFISSPSRIARELWRLMTGTGGDPSLWGYLWPTVEASIIGVAVGMVLGGAAGLLLSSSRLVADVLHPFAVALNAVPRIALIPIVVILFGPTLKASIVISLMVVFFVAFFSAYEGGRAVDPEMIENARLLGAGTLGIMWHIRLRYVMAWTLAALPLGVTFGIIAVVTGEILTGNGGLGTLIAVADAQVNASLTFAVVVVLSVLGLLFVGLASLMRRRVLHWWTQS